MRDYFRQTMTAVADPSTWVDLVFGGVWLSCLGLLLYGCGGTW